MSTKIDLKKKYPQLFKAPKDPVIVDVPAFNFLMIDGQGDPNQAQAYKDAVSALYSLAYKIKFSIKKDQGIDYGVPPLEGLWWTPDMADFSVDDKSAWHWTMMIMQPEYVTPEIVAAAREEVRAKKNPPLLDDIRLESYQEGLCAQLLHTGPYADEAPNIQRLHAFIEQQGYQLRGMHHEIYLSDPTRTAPERLKTIIRQPAG